MDPTNSINKNLPFNPKEIKKGIHSNANCEPELRISVLRKNHLIKVQKESESKQKLSHPEIVTPIDNRISSKLNSFICLHFRHYFSCFSR